MTIAPPALPPGKLPIAATVRTRARWHFGRFFRVIGEVLDGTRDVAAELDDGVLPFEGRVVTDMVRLLRYRRRLLTGD